MHFKGLLAAAMTWWVLGMRVACPGLGQEQSLRLSGFHVVRFQVGLAGEVVCGRCRARAGFQRGVAILPQFPKLSSTHPWRINRTLNWKKPSRSSA